VAIRRYLLYDVFLHELGHLQVVDSAAKSDRRKFAMETKAQEFAMGWCEQLWSRWFDHPDLVHSAPTEAELADEDPDLTELLRRAGHCPDDAKLFQILGKTFYTRQRMAEAKEAYERSLSLDPSDPWTHLYLGNWHYTQEEYLRAIDCFSLAAELLPDRSPAFRCLGDAHDALGQVELAGMHYRKAVAVEPSCKLARKNLRAWQARCRERSDESRRGTGGSVQVTPR
jgi:tetratricopeptide (TPR) repeat protein